MPDNEPNTETEITKWGKFLAGFLLIALTFVAIYYVIGYWPDKMPPLDKGDNGAWYTNKLFHIDLIENTGNADSATIPIRDSLHKILKSVEKNIAQLKADSINKDSATLNLRRDLLKNSTDSVAKLKEQISQVKANPQKFEDGSIIHLNTILLILVALMGFLGNLVHIASSFTSFVGNGSFKRSWILWYCVKPFTAAALAIIVYFIIRAGFLSYGTGAAGVSLYGILSLSALAGLFTDSATLKLKEVFEVIFKPKDERQDKLTEPEVSVTSVSPLTIPHAGESVITIKGASLDAQGIKITFDGNEIKPATVTKDTITIKYNPDPAAITAAKTVLVLTDKSGNIKVTKDIVISP